MNIQDNYRLVLSVLLVCFVLVNAGCQTKLPELSEWKTYTSPDGNMQVKFPYEPTIEQQSVASAVGVLKFEMVTLEISRTLAFTSSTMTYPVDPSMYDVKAGLQGSVDGARQNSKSTIVSDIEITKDGIPGREVIMQNNEGMFFKARTYIDGSGPTIFQANVVGTSQLVVENEEATRFLDSLEILKK